MSIRSFLSSSPYKPPVPIREPNMPEKRDEKKDDKKKRKEKKPVIRLDGNSPRQMKE